MLIHKRLRELLYGVKRFILGKSLLSALVSLTHIIQAGFLGKIVRLLYEKASISGMLTYIAAIIGLIMLRMLLIMFNQYYGKSIIGKIKYTLRKRAVRLTMPPVKASSKDSRMSASTTAASWTLA